ncbi:Transcription initiation factor TFIID subunit 11 [Candida viswanathii]|uniref:Transcription initiation factor TFIID subunit 11 n=1 Tax=Candida viswanathii TaxID=5486 RepID=A0A367YIT0_9ASCO|nr:Transcription initiation factor TFIID subunit 11 [Candida viswanathii]
MSTPPTPQHTHEDGQHTPSPELDLHDYDMEVGEDDGYVSLDEEDEELIWRVFFHELEKYEQAAQGYEESSDDDDDEEEEEKDEDDNGYVSDDGDSESSTDEHNIEDLLDVDDAELVAKYRALKSEKINRNLTEEEQKRLLIANFTDEQMERFEAYRRMTINKPGVKKICNGIVGHTIPQIIAVVMAGISKLFLGDIITKAFEVQKRDYKGQLILDIEAKKDQKRQIQSSLQRGQDIEVDERELRFEGDEIHPLQPHHIREAWRLYKLENSGYPGGDKRKSGDDGPFYV